MDPLEPFVIDGKTYLHVKRAAEVIGHVCEATVWNWAKRGETPWGFTLDVVHERPPPDREWKHSYPRRRPLNVRTLIAEESVNALKEILDSHVRQGMRAYTAGDLADLETATRRQQRRVAHATTPNP